MSTHVYPTREDVRDAVLECLHERTAVGEDALVAQVLMRYPLNTRPGVEDVRVWRGNPARDFYRLVVLKRAADGRFICQVAPSLNNGRLIWEGVGATAREAWYKADHAWRKDVNRNVSAWKRFLVTEGENER